MSAAKKDTAPLIYGKMIAVMKAMPAIGKDESSPQLKYAFRGIDSIYNVLHGLFAEHGIFLMPEVVSHTRDEGMNKSGNTFHISELEMRYTFYAEDGSSVTGTTVGLSFDYSDKGANQAMSAAHKYMLVQAFMIHTGGNDTEKQNIEGGTIRKLPAPNHKKTLDKNGMEATMAAIDAGNLKQARNVLKAVSMTDDQYRAIEHAIKIKEEESVKQEKYTGVRNGTDKANAR